MPRGSKREHAATEALLDQATNAYFLIERGAPPVPRELANCLFCLLPP
jgi:hypothetical protein